MIPCKCKFSHYLLKFLSTQNILRVSQRNRIEAFIETTEVGGTGRKQPKNI